jgi:hypothetical protein
MKPAQFTGRELQRYILTLFAYDLGRIPCTMYKLAPFARLKLNIMYQCSHRNGLQWQSIAGFYINIYARLYSIS